MLMAMPCFCPQTFHLAPCRAIILCRCVVGSTQCCEWQALLGEMQKMRTEEVHKISFVSNVSRTEKIGALKVTPTTNRFNIRFGIWLFVRGMLAQWTAAGECIRVLSYLDFRVSAVGLR